MAFVSGPALPSSRTNRASTSSTCTVRMTNKQSNENKVSRRELIATSLAIAAGTLLTGKAALADREYANVGFLGGGDQIDVNNANVRAYLKIQGFYPGLAGLLASNGPYESFEDLYKIPGITDQQKELLKKNEEKLVVLPPAAEYEIDKLNNGLYR